MAKTTNAATDTATEEVNLRNPTPEKGMPDFDKWTDEQIGFAPYWKPGPGLWFYGAPVAIDMRDPKFIRYQFIAGLETPCRRGPGDEDDERAENVTVPKGGTFSISVYYSLRDAFDEYLQYGADSGQPIMVRVDALKTVPTKNQPKCWQFRARLAPEQSKQLAAWRTKHRKVLPPPADREALEE